MIVLFSSFFGGDMKLYISLTFRCDDKNFLLFIQKVIQQIVPFKALIIYHLNIPIKYIKQNLFILIEDYLKKKYYNG